MPGDRPRGIGKASLSPRDHLRIGSRSRNSGTVARSEELANALRYADNNTSTSRIYTTDRARMVPDFVLVEKDDLLLGNDPLGIYEFPRSAKKK
jgi:hypothetical protein